MTVAARAMPRRSLVLGAALLGTLAVGLVITVTLADLSGVAFFIAYAGTGAFLVIRRPGNSIGWLLTIVGWGLAIGSIRCTVPVDALESGALDAGQMAIAWANGCGWALAFLGFLGITLVFPGGGLPTGRWRWPAVAAVGAMLLLVVMLMTGPTINVTPTMTGIPIDVPNPIGVAPASFLWTLVPDGNSLFATMFAFVVAGVASVAVRFRRSAGLVRQQYRWLVAAIVAIVVASLIWAITFVGMAIDSPLVWLAVSVAYPCVPLAIAIAVLRYRLYDIDRIVSRTLAYGALTAILFGVFAAVDIAAHSLVPQMFGGSTIGVAVSTLAVAALFNPLRVRLQALVDRRFNRARYDADRLVVGFSQRVRDGSDLPTLVSELTDTSRRAVEPRRAGVWIRGASSRTGSAT